jgi:hypothetical protein
MADKDKSPAKPAKTQFEINKEMLDEMAGKPGVPVKPPKSMAKLKDKIDKELPPPLDSKIAGQLEPSDKAPAPKWDAYSQGEWRCNDCDTTFKHFQPLLSGHMKQHGHNFSLYDRETGEKKASSLSEARSGGHFGNFSKGGKAKKRKNKPAQSDAIIPPPAAQQKQSPPVVGDTQPSLDPPPPALPDRVAQFMADNPALVQWIEENPGQRPPDDLLNKEPVGSPQIKSSIIVKYVRTTAEVTAALEVLYDLIVSNPLSIEKGYNPTLGEWMEDTIFEHYRAFAKHYKLENFFRKFLGGDNA